MQLETSKRRLKRQSTSPNMGLLVFYCSASSSHLIRGKSAMINYWPHTVEVEVLLALFSYRWRCTQVWWAGPWQNWHIIRPLSLSQDIIGTSTYYTHTFSKKVTVTVGTFRRVRGVGAGRSGGGGGRWQGLTRGLVKVIPLFFVGFTHK